MLAGGLIALALAMSNPSPAEGNIDPKAQDVIDRTRTTTRPHVVYYRAHSSAGYGKQKYWLSAVFHQGAQFRTESPWIRITADCAKGTAVQLEIVAKQPGGGKYTADPKYAKQACGISADREILSARWIGKKLGRFGPFDQIEIIEKKGSYIYSVGRGGEILGVTMTPTGDPNPIVTEAVAFEYELPDGELFSIKSLERSAIPSEIKRTWVSAPR